MSSSIIKALINSTIKEENKLQPLTFTLTSPGAHTFKTYIKGSPNISGLQYRLGTTGPWLPYDVNSSISLAGIGYSIQFQNTNDTLSIDKNNYFTFYITGSATASVSGNIISMINYKELSTYCFYQLFRFCAVIQDASELILPDTTAPECYNNLFYYCSNLITPPVLPATTLSTGCYSAMFQNCGKLSVAPELPATTLTSYCYNQMFESCKSLTTPPVLPATTLTDSCYRGMFKFCSALKTAPELPATTAYMYCYTGMFEGCTSLTKAPFLPATSLRTSCYSDMFKGCTSLNYIKVAFTDYYLGSFTSNWVENVSPTGTFASTTTYSKIQFGPSYIPAGWAIEGRNIIYGSDETISYEINKDFQYNVNFIALPETQEPATITIVDGTLPEDWSINGTTIIGNSSSLDNVSLKVKIEIAGYESYQKTINFNFYEQAKLTDYKLYIPLSNVDTALINDGDDANKFYLTQYSSSYKVNIVEVTDESGQNLIKCADFYEGSGNSCPTLVGNNALYQNLLKGNNPWTIAFKAYFKGCVVPAGKTNNVLQIGSAYGAGKRLRFGLRPINDRFYLYLDTYNIDDVDETQAEARSFDLNTWYNIVVTYENRTLKYYYNNELVATTSINQDLNLDLYSGYDTFCIGGYSSEYSWRNNSPNCYMKDLLLFNRVLTEDEIKTLGGGDSEPEVEPSQPLTFKLAAVDGNNSDAVVSLDVIEGSPVVDGLVYRKDEADKWQKYECGTQITLTGDEYVQFKNTNTQLNSVDSTSTESPAYNFVSFKTHSGLVAAEGNIQSMLNYNDSCTDSCYYHMFEDCSGLVKAPELPATKLADSCYNSMFFGCSNLAEAPELPATEMAHWCYKDMFKYCSKLEKTPYLPATQLTKECYRGMFSHCSSLNEIDVNFSSWDDAVPEEGESTELEVPTFNWLYKACTYMQEGNTVTSFKKPVFKCPADLVKNYDNQYNSEQKYIPRSINNIFSLFSSNILYIASVITPNIKLNGTELKLDNNYLKGIQRTWSGTTEDGLSLKLLHSTNSQFSGTKTGWLLVDSSVYDMMDGYYMDSSVIYSLDSNSPEPFNKKTTDIWNEYPHYELYNYNDSYNNENYNNLGIQIHPKEYSYEAQYTSVAIKGAGNTEANGIYKISFQARDIDSYGYFPIFQNTNSETDIYMYFSSQCGYSWAPGWSISPNIIDEGAGMLYCTYNEATQYPTGFFANWSTLDGVEPRPKCYELDSNGNIILPVDYTVTGAGTAAVNGYYYNTGETKGNYPVYANSNGVKLWFFNMMGGWVFSNDYSESTSDWYYHCEAYGDVTTGSWADDALYPTVDALGAAPLPTVTKGGSVEVADYIVSNASKDFANGEYYYSPSEKINDYPVYRNADGNEIYMSLEYGWCISDDTYMLSPLHTSQGNYDPVPPTTGWSDGVIVTKS